MAGLSRAEARRRRHRRVRRRVSGTAQRPRLAVFRSLKHTYAQVIDDERGVTLAAASSGESGMPAAEKSKRALEVGRRVAERAAELDITKAVFDRGGFKFHGRVKAVAQAARKAGLEF